MSASLTTYPVRQPRRNIRLRTRRPVWPWGSVVFSTDAGALVRLVVEFVLDRRFIDLELLVTGVMVGAEGVERDLVLLGIARHLRA